MTVLLIYYKNENMVVSWLTSCEKEYSKLDRSYYTNVKFYDRNDGPHKIIYDLNKNNKVCYKKREDYYDFKFRVGM